MKAEWRAWRRGGKRQGTPESKTINRETLVPPKNNRWCTTENRKHAADLHAVESDGHRRPVGGGASKLRIRLLMRVCDLVCVCVCVSILYWVISSVRSELKAS